MRWTAFVVALVVAACSSGSDSVSPAASAPPSVAATFAPPPTAAPETTTTTTTTIAATSTTTATTLPPVERVALTGEQAAAVDRCVLNASLVLEGFDSTVYLAIEACFEAADAFESAGAEVAALAALGMAADVTSLGSTLSQDDYNAAVIGRDS